MRVNINKVKKTKIENMNGECGKVETLQGEYVTYAGKVQNIAL